MTSIKNLYHTKNEIFWLLLFIGLTCYYIVLATLANADLTAGRFALFMDERITFDGVHNILHADGLKKFILKVIGGFQTYGRSFFYTTAVFSFVPEFYFGESGQIFAGRMIQVVILLSAFILLTVTFVRHWALRFLLLASLLAMPYTVYFMSMPKPEPLQMLFLSVFLFFFQKNELKLGQSYWIFLGLAFGTKISVLPAVVIFFIAASLKQLPKTNLNKYASECIVAFGFFLTGLVIAVPILIPNVVASFIAYKMAEKYLLSKLPAQEWLTKFSTIASLTAINLIFEGILHKFGFKTGLSIWLNSTFLQEPHGANRSNIGFGSWINYFLNDWMVAPVAITTILIVTSTALAIRFIMQQSEDRRFQNWPASTVPFFIMLSGLALNLTLFASAHRLWGHYLFPGTVLILVGLLAIFESYLLTDEYSLRKHNTQGNKSEYFFALFGLFLASTITFFWWLPQSIVKYIDLANRTSSFEYKKQYQAYIDLTQFLTKYAIQQNKRLFVSFDPNVFIPESNERYQITEFWGPYSNWETNPDVIIFSDRHTRKPKPVQDDSPYSYSFIHPAQKDTSDHDAFIQPIQKNSPSYDKYIKERNGYNKYVIETGSECLQEKCYQRHIELANGGEILVLMLQKSGK